MKKKKNSIDLIDQLYQEVSEYKTPQKFKDLLSFCVKFKRLSPFNAMLVNMQCPGAKFVLNAWQWRKLYNRVIKSGARPLIILSTFGPIDYVFDVNDTLDIDPSQPSKIIDNIIYEKTIELPINKNIIDDIIRKLPYLGIHASESSFGKGFNGFLRHLPMQERYSIEAKYGRDQDPIYIPIYYHIEINKEETFNNKFSTLIHELAHFFCHHLPAPATPDLWWNQRNLTLDIEEFEAETCAYLVCHRLNIDTKGQTLMYLDGYFQKNHTIIGVSISNILRASYEIEKLINTSYPISQSLLYKKHSKFKATIKQINGRS